MTTRAALSPDLVDERLAKIIKVAVLAVGGQGGGVLTSWIEATARAQGYACQATSVAGVAQRTGATIYYIELAPMGAQTPIFSLAPTAGDVDIVIAAEMVEAGRAIMRGFVTPDRTTLIASTHRNLAVSEKVIPGNGIAETDRIVAAAEIAAEHFIRFDMDQVALDQGSVISAALFGALAGSGVLPFSRESFEEAIRASRRGVGPSLAAFSVAFDKARRGSKDAGKVRATPPASFQVKGPAKVLRKWQALVARLQALPTPVQSMAWHGLRKVTDFQDVAYGDEYLRRLEDFVGQDSLEQEFVLSREAAKYIANAMAYDDVIRVADLKTRAARFQRIERDMQVGDRTLKLTEFMHPRAEEIVGMLPAPWGARLENNQAWMRRLDQWFNRGRRVRTHRLSSFLILYLLGGLRSYRRRTLRHKHEMDHLNGWIKTCQAAVAQDYDFACELLRCRRLIKGYSDTHHRSHSKFDRLMEGAKLLWARDDAAPWVAQLRDSALKDEKGEALDGALQTIRSFL